jgi:lecithin:retinol acyltransferase
MPDADRLYAVGERSTRARSRRATLNTRSSGTGARIAGPLTPAGPRFHAKYCESWPKSRRKRRDASWPCSSARHDSTLMRPFRRRDNNGDRSSGRGSRPGGLHGDDRLLCTGEEPSPGAHLVTPRRGFLHHGIYVGNGAVVHYAGLAHGFRRGPIEEISLARFGCGQPIWIRNSGQLRFAREEVICRARSRVGESSYRLLTNNCEHLCEWCLRGEPRSFQIEAWRARPRHTLIDSLRLIASLLHGAESFPVSCRCSSWRATSSFCGQEDYIE